MKQLSLAVVLPILIAVLAPLFLIVVIIPVILGVSLESGGDGGDMAQIAYEEYERGEKDGTRNGGGQKYWSEFGFEGRVEWCGCFAGWCAKQAGLVAGETMPDNPAWAANWIAFYDQHPDAGTIHENDGKFEPPPGALAVNGARDASWSQHIEVVYECSDGYVTTVGGNTRGHPGYTSINRYPLGVNWTYFSMPNYPESSGGKGSGALMAGVNFNMSEAAFVNEWGGRIDKWYSKHHSGAPLGGHGKDFARSAYRYHIDPRLVCSISIIESSGGRNCWTSYNAWGWAAADGAYDYNKGTFSSWANGIDTVSKGLAKGYSDLKSVEEIGKRYCPPNWREWSRVVSSEMAKI